MRVAIAELKQETNTFVPRLTTMADFEAWHYWTGPDLIDGLGGTNSEIDGFLNVLTAAGIEPVPILATFAMSGGKVEDATYDRLLGELLTGIANAGQLDGILIALHGAMVTESDDSPDANTLKAIRDLVGPNLPVVATYDLHANLTARMAEYADALVGFKTSPHIDQRDTGERGARVMTAILQQGAKPTMAFVKIPMVVPASTHIHHLPGPFKRLQDATKELEKEPGVLSANVAAVQPWLDIDEMGFATVVITDDDPKRAKTLACDLAKACWHERDAFMEIELVPIAEAIQLALAEPSGPVVLSDCADGTGAGSPGDATAVIAALLEADPDKTGLRFRTRCRKRRVRHCRRNRRDRHPFGRRQARQHLQPTGGAHRHGRVRRSGLVPLRRRGLHRRRAGHGPQRGRARGQCVRADRQHLGHDRRSGALPRGWTGAKRCPDRGRQIGHPVPRRLPVRAAQHHARQSRDEQRSHHVTTLAKGPAPHLSARSRNVFYLPATLFSRQLEVTQTQDS